MHCFSHIEFAWWMNIVCLFQIGNHPSSKCPKTFITFSPMKTMCGNQQPAKINDKRRVMYQKNNLNFHHTGSERQSQNWQVRVAPALIQLSAPLCSYDYGPCICCATLMYNYTFITKYDRFSYSILNAAVILKTKNAKPHSMLLFVHFVASVL